MRRALLLLTAVALMVVGYAGAAIAASVVDQQHTSLGTALSILPHQIPAQTFTAGVDGELDKVSVAVSKNVPSGAPSPGDVIATIESVDADGKPSGIALGSGTAAAESFPTNTFPGQFVDINLTQPVQVSAGTKYALVLYTPQASGPPSSFYYWSAGTRDSYGGGSMWIGTTNHASYDMVFKTYVSVDDTTAPVLNLPTDITQKATSSSGAVVNFTATANDETDGSVPVSCDKNSGDSFPVGTTTVTCTATDAANNQATGTFKVSVLYDFGNGSGGSFAEPVRATELNQLKAGQAVPVKFGLGGDFGPNIFASGYPTAKRIDCNTGMTIDPVEETVTASTSGLRYDAASALYSYVWKTEKSWSGTCRELNLKLADGTNHPVKFQLK